VFVELWKKRPGATKKREERDKEEEQHEEQLEEVSLLQSSPYKLTMVVEVCYHRHELSIVVKVCCLHEDFFLCLLKNFIFIYFSFYFCFQFFFLFFLVFLIPFFWHFKKSNFFLSFFLFNFFYYQ
jgi:hypothetical protein